MGPKEQFVITAYEEKYFWCIFSFLARMVMRPQGIMYGSLGLDGSQRLPDDSARRSDW